MKSRFKDKLLNPYSLIIIILFWIVTCIWFYQKELSFHYPPIENTGYKAILPEDLLIEDVWKSIYFNNKKIGYSHTYLRLLGERKEGKYLIENSSIIYLPFGVKDSKVYFHSKAKLSNKKLLKNFKITIRSNRFNTEIQGERIGTKKLKVTQKRNSNKNIFLVNIPKNLILSSFLQPTSRFKNKNLKQDFSFNVFNPFLMKKQKVNVKYQRTKNTEKGKIYVLKCQYQNFDYTIWVNNKGQIIKETSPMGIKILKTTSSEATKNLRQIQKTSLRNQVSVPVKINYPDIKKLTMLKLKLKNINPDILELNFANQTVIEKKPNFVILKIQKSKDQENKKRSIKQKKLEEFLAATPYIQKNNSKIKKLVQKITHNSPTPTSKIKNILSWFENNIRQTPTFSLPSATEVLNNKVGDCNEISYLFASLSRAVNIPTKLVTGLVYINGKFQYHMWNEVYINNKWISVDPTFIQFPTDVTHIGLIQGGYENQLKLSNIVSKIGIEIINLKAR